MTAAERAMERYMKIIVRHGTAAEKQGLREDLETMRALRAFNVILTDTFAPPGVERDYGTGWQWPEEIRIIDHLARRAEGVAQARVARAIRNQQRDRAGAVKSVEDETRSVKAQMAAMLMIGVDFDTAPRTYQDAKKHGNIGGDVSAFCPKPGSSQLIVGEKEPQNRRFMLVVEVTENVFAWRGWDRVKRLKRDQYQREFVRNGVVSRPYLIPAEMLNHPWRWA